MRKVDQVSAGVSVEKNGDLIAWIECNTQSSFVDYLESNCAVEDFFS